MCAAPLDHDADLELTTDRLLLRSITPGDVEAVLDDRRLPEWAPDFPAPGDQEIARMLTRTGVPGGSDRAFGIRLILERATGQVIGGVGFFGPPRDGRVEIGYGIVESRRRRGYATEAVTAMLDYAFTRPGVIEVVATADLDNPASIRVLDKSGLSYQSQAEARVTYLITAR